MRIAYFGLPLGALLLHQDGHELVTVTLSPVSAPGARRLRRRVCASRILDARRLERDALEVEVARRVAEARPELVVSWYWTRRLSEAVLMQSQMGAIGVHPSLLPRHRGPNPFFWAIDAGDVDTGVTVHRLAPTYDTGAILVAARISVNERDSWQLARALDAPGLCLLRQTVHRLARGDSLSGTPQDESVATEAPEPEGDALRVDFSWSTRRILRRVRALSPVPGLALELRGLRLFVTRASATESFPRALRPGEAASFGGCVVIRTGDGAMALERVALDGPDELETLTAAELVRRFDDAPPSS